MEQQTSSGPDPEGPVTPSASPVSRPMSRRTALRWSGAALAALAAPAALAACGSDGSGGSDGSAGGTGKTSSDGGTGGADRAPSGASSASPPAKSGSGGGSGKTVSIWLMKYYVDAANAVIEEAAKAAGQQGGFDVDIQWFPFDATTYSKWAAAVEAKQLPDIGMPNGYPSQYWAMGKLVDLTDLSNEIAQDGGGWYDYVEDYQTVDGKKWWIPLFNELAFGLYRKDVFEAKGITAPITGLDDLVAAATEVTDPSKKMWGMGMAMAYGDWPHNLPPVMWDFGASLQDTKGNIVSGSDEFVDAITWYTNLYLKDKVTPPGVTSWTSASNNEFYAAGQIAFCSNTGSIIASLRADHPDLLDNTVTSAWGQRGDRGPYSVSNLPAVFITKDSQLQDEAKLVIKTIMSKEYRGKFLIAANANFLPVLKDDVSISFFSENDLNKHIVTDILPKAQTRWWPAQATPTFSEVDSQQLWGTLLQRITAQGWTPRKAVDEFTEAANKINDKYRKLYPDLFG